MSEGSASTEFKAVLGSVEHRTELGTTEPWLLVKVGREGRWDFFPHVCSCEDIRLDPLGISDPAIMRLLPGEATTSSFLLSIKSFKKYKL